MNGVFTNDWLSRAIEERERKKNAIIFDSCKKYKDFNEMFYKFDFDTRVYPDELFICAERLIKKHNLKIKNKFDLYDKILDLMVEIEDAMKNQKLRERFKELWIKHKELIKAFSEKV